MKAKRLCVFIRFKDSWAIRPRATVKGLLWAWRMLIIISVVKLYLPHSSTSPPRPVEVDWRARSRGRGGYLHLWHLSHLLFHLFQSAPPQWLGGVVLPWRRWRQRFTCMWQTQISSKTTVRSRRNWSVHETAFRPNVTICGGVSRRARCSSKYPVASSDSRRTGDHVGAPPHRRAECFDVSNTSRLCGNQASAVRNTQGKRLKLCSSPDYNGAHTQTQLKR